MTEQSIKVETVWWKKYKSLGICNKGFWFKRKQIKNLKQIAILIKPKS